VCCALSVVHCLLAIGTVCGAPLPMASSSLVVGGWQWVVLPVGCLAFPGGLRAMHWVTSAMHVAAVCDLVCSLAVTTIG
jgi:hypothetical protein